MRHYPAATAALILAALALTSCTANAPDAEPSSSSATPSAQSPAASPAAASEAAEWEPATIRNPADIGEMAKLPTLQWQISSGDLWDNHDDVRALGASADTVAIGSLTDEGTTTGLAGIAVASGSPDWRYAPEAGTTRCAAGALAADAVACATSAPETGATQLWTLGVADGKVAQSIDVDAGQIYGIDTDGESVYAVLIGTDAPTISVLAWKPGDAEVRWQTKLPEVVPTPISTETHDRAEVTAYPNAVTVQFGDSDQGYELTPADGKIVSIPQTNISQLTTAGDVLVVKFGGDLHGIKHAGTTQMIVDEESSAEDQLVRLAIDAASTDLQTLAVKFGENNTYQTAMHARANGQVIWSTDVSEQMLVPVGVCEQKVVLLGDDQLVALDLRTGKQLWSQATPENMATTSDGGYACASGNLITMSSRDMAAYSLADGSITWQGETNTSYNSATNYLVLGGHLLYSSGSSVDLWA